MSLGVNVLLRVVEQVAGRLGPDWDVEIIEMHHDQKKDKPSGTARLTAERIEAAAPRLAPVSVHSVRLPGLVAHHSVLFGTTGQTLELRHDSLARESFDDGILLAVREVRKQQGLVVGLDLLLFGGAR
jgi:4-hydroxy-tetrahydrodipicolinate reductase